MPMVTFREHFKNGIQPKKEGMAGAEFLETCIGSKPDVTGLVNYSTYTDPTSGLSTQRTFPFPQIFRGEYLDYVVGTDKLYFLDSSNSPQEISVYSTSVSATQNLANATITGSTSWDFSDASWAYSSNTAVLGPNLGSSPTLTQTQANLSHAFVNGKIYRIRVNISSVSVVGQFKVGIGAVESSMRTAQTGIMEFELKATGNGNFTVVADNSLEMVITEITVNEVPVYGDFGFDGTSKPLQFVQFKEVWFACNDEIFIFHTPSNGTVGRSVVAGEGPAWRVNAVPAATMKISTIARMGNTLYMGGFDPTLGFFNSADFQDIWNTWINHRRNEITYEGYEIKPNVCFYSKMNGGDFYWPWAMELALFGIPDTDILSDAKSFIIDAIKKGELGFFEWPMKGEVLNMMQLGQDLYAYGTDGVCSATPQQFGDAVAHMTLNKSKIGVADKGAVWGDKDEAMHFYVDKKAHLRMVNPQQISDLMYQGELEDMVTNVATEPIIMSYDPDEGDLYICTATRARTYTKNSMGQPKQVITSIINDEGEAIAVKYNAPEYSQRNRIITSPFDFEERMSKFIHDMELGIYDVTNCRARVWYKDDNSTNWRPGEWHNLFTGGFLSPDISGFDFKLEVEYDAGSNFRFEYIRVNYQQRDERNFRIHQRRY